MSARPVVIVGGGPVGLFLSLLLREFAAPSILLEQQSVEERFRHPQAHFLNTRSMEIMKHCLPNIYSQVQAAMPPVKHWQDFRFGANMATSEPLAIVRHPVDRPLQVATDANGVLLDDDSSISEARNPVLSGGIVQYHQNYLQKQMTGSSSRRYV